MAMVIVLSLLALALVILPAVAGVDTRDGRDWQPPPQWRDRRGCPLD
jgi:hypothetical protein